MTTLAVKDLSVRYNGSPATDRVSLTAEAGAFVGLIGPNGAGKTTLIRAMANLIPFEGSVTLDGRPVRAIARNELAKSISYLAQGQDVHWPLKVRDVVALGRLPHLSRYSQPSAADRAAIESAMERADVVYLSERSVMNLSGGERARVMLARALAVEAPLLLVDEPIAALDPFHQLQIMDVLAAHSERGGAVISVLHDLSLAARFCRRLILMSRGKVVADGETKAVLDSPALEAVYKVAVHRGERDGVPYVLPWKRNNGGA